MSLGIIEDPKLLHSQDHLNCYSIQKSIFKSNINLPEEGIKRAEVKNMKSNN